MKDAKGMDGAEGEHVISNGDLDDWMVRDLIGRSVVAVRTTPDKSIVVTFDTDQELQVYGCEGLRWTPGVVN